MRIEPDIHPIKVSILGLGTPVQKNRDKRQQKDLFETELWNIIWIWLILKGCSVTLIRIYKIERHLNHSCFASFLHVTKGCWIYFLQSAKSRGSLILIDRTLDLVGPSGHSCDTLADRIIQLLPRLTQHNSDVAVDMSPLCSHGRYATVTFLKKKKYKRVQYQKK